MTVTPLIDRSVPFTFTRAVDDETGNDGLNLQGYAAVFEEKTEIDSWEGSFTETIRKGAFRKSIRERTPVLQFEHGRHPLVGSLPIGRIQDLREDNEGLYVEARLSDNWLIEPVRTAIRDESVTGMSFRFEVIRDEWRDNKGKLLKGSELSELLWDPGERGPLERTLVELKVRELGPVVFPQYEGTTVSVRAREVAEEITHRGALRRGILRSLGADGANTNLADDIDDELRHEVACAVLFPEASPAVDTDGDTRAEDGITDAPPDEGHASPPDAPPEPGHTSNPDAPPEVGHPSMTAHEQRQFYARRAYMTRESVGKRFK